MLEAYKKSDGSTEDRASFDESGVVDPEFDTAQCAWDAGDCE